MASLKNYSSKTTKTNGAFHTKICVILPRKTSLIARPFASNHFVIRYICEQNIIHNSSYSQEYLYLCNLIMANEKIAIETLSNTINRHFYSKFIITA